MSEQPTGKSASEINFTPAITSELLDGDALRAADRQSVSIEQGHNILRFRDSSIAEFLEASKELPIGQEARTALEQLVQKIGREGEGLFVEPTGPARFQSILFHEAERYDRESTEGFGHYLDFSVETMRNIEIELFDVLDKLGIKVSMKELEELASNWLIWHELGHALQSADMLATKTSKGDRVIRSLARKHLQADPSAALPIAGNPGPLIRGIEDERIAEGLAHLLLKQKLMRTHGLDQSRLMGYDSMTRSGWRSSAAHGKASRLLEGWQGSDAYLHDSDQTVTARLFDYVESQGDDVNCLLVLGYANYYSDYELTSILRFTE